MTSRRTSSLRLNLFEVKKDERKLSLEDAVNYILNNLRKNFLKKMYPKF